MTVQINISSDRLTLTVEAPYNPDFPARAKALGGRWQPATKRWEFDARDESRVRSVCLDVYGDDGTPQARVTLRATAKADLFAERDSIYLAGRPVARAFSRDSGARLGDGVVVLEGGSPDSGGSRTKWRTTIPKGCVLEIRDVPVAAMPESDSCWEIEAASPGSDAIAAARLRVAEIEAMLEAAKAELAALLEAGS